MPGSQDFEPDSRNENALVYVNGAFFPKHAAKVSVFDAGFVLGDGVWEGLRLHHGKLLFLDAHLDRLFSGANQIRLNLGLSRGEIEHALYRTLDVNGMKHGAHLRLMATRGVKKTVNQDPRNALGSATLVIVAEYKSPPERLAREGLSVWTSSIRTSGADTFDMRLNSHSRLNLIQALIDVLDKGADEALMLDPHGLVASCNATNFFFVKGGVVCTSSGRYCFNGITRANVVELAQRHSVPIQVGDFTLDDVAGASEAFVTGTFGGVTPVCSIDGRALPAALPGPFTTQMKSLYEAAKDAEAGHV